MQLKARQTTDKKKEINVHSRIFNFPCFKQKRREIKELKPYLSAQTCILRV